MVREMLVRDRKSPLGARFEEGKHGGIGVLHECPQETING